MGMRRTFVSVLLVGETWASAVFLAAVLCGAAACAADSDQTAIAADRVAGKLITFNDNGGWSWFESERVIADAGFDKIVLSSVANGEGVGGRERDGDVDVVSYDLAKHALQKFTLNKQLEADDHDSAALLALPDGRYLASYSKHSSDNRLRYRLSTKPGDIGAWEPEKVYQAAAGTTYSNLCYLARPDTVFDFHRDHGRGFDPNYVLWRVGDPAGFRYGGRLFTGPEGNNGNRDRPYVRYVGNGVDRVHFLTTDHHPRNLKSNGLYHGYVRFEGEGKYGVYRTDGTRLGDLSTSEKSPYQASDFTPLLKGDEVSPANQLRMTRGWATDIELDSRGQPYVVFTARVDDNDDDHRFFYGCFTDGRWHIHELAKAGGHLYDSENDYTGLAALDPADRGRVFVATKIDPRDQSQLPHYEIFEGNSSDVGASWKWSPITQNSSVDNIRPVVPRGVNGSTVLVWMRGRYETYRKYNTSIVGLVKIGSLSQK